MFLEREIKAWAVIKNDQQAWEDAERDMGVNWIHHVLYVCEMWKVNYRDVMTIDYALDHHAEVLETRCPCGMYMLRRMDQDLVYCWECECSRAISRRGRALLDRLQNKAQQETLKAKGLHVIEADAPIMPEEEQRGPFASGMPL